MGDPDDRKTIRARRWQAALRRLRKAEKTLRKADSDLKVRAAAIAVVTAEDAAEKAKLEYVRGQRY